MLGVLCGDKGEKKYAEKIHSIYKQSGNEKDNNIVIFTISNIDFKDMTVKGRLVSGGDIKLVRTAIPRVILNVSVQRRGRDIKKLRRLAEFSDITLINEVNRFDQWMIMEIISSSELTKKYALSHHIYDKKARNYKPDDNKDYIVMPSRGSSLSRVIFTKPDSDTGQIGGSQYFRKGHICDYIDASLCQKRWIFIEAPDIMIQHNLPVIIRAYVQRGSGGNWNVLGGNIYPRMQEGKENLYRRIYKPALEIMNYITRFVPNLGICHIDFVFDSEGSPYFLHFGGFDTHFILNQNRSKEFYHRFYSNLIQLSDLYSRKPEEV
jgi:hypothetical protein